MSNITDVCHLAGVSKATVSRVLNGTGQVKASTKEKVYAAMKELDYRPNTMARALATNHTHTIGLVLAEFMTDYFASIMQQAATIAEKSSYKLIIAGGHNSPEKEYEEVCMLSDRCDAIIMYTRQMPASMLLQLKSELKIPLILFNRDLITPIFPAVIFEERSAMMELTRDLMNQGHKHIAVIAANLKNGRSQSRLDAVVDVLQEQHIAFNSNLLVTGFYQLQGGYDGCKTLLQQPDPFTAIIAFNDLMAMGALKALQEEGIAVPEQISLTGVDNIPVSQFTHPALTTIVQPMETMVQCAMSIAIELGEAKDLENTQQYYFNGKYVQRDSIAHVGKE